MKPNDTLSLYQKAEIYSQLSDNKSISESMSILTKITTITDPTFPEAWFLKGFLLITKYNKTNSGMECIDKVLQLNPNHKNAKQFKEQLLLSTKK